MAEVLGGTPGAAAGGGAKKPKGGRVLAEVDFDAEIFTDFKDQAHVLTDANESSNGTYAKAMKDLYSDAEVKTGVPKAIIKLLFTDERADAKKAKKLRALTKHEKLGLQKVIDGFGADSEFGKMAAEKLRIAEEVVQ